MELSYTQQDYLKTIWKLEDSLQVAKMKLIAKEVGVKPPTVSAMIRQLEQMNLITYSKKTGACLTGDGKREAEKLEHAISDHLIGKIDEYLGHPSTDPHGSKIPGPYIGTKTCQLDEIDENVEFSIQEIPATQKEKNYCLENGFTEGSSWRLEQIGPNRESFLVTDGNNYLALSAMIASNIMVEKI